MPPNATKVTGNWSISFKTKVKAWTSRVKSSTNDSASLNLDVTSCYVSITNYTIYHTTTSSIGLADNIFGIGY